MANPYSTLVTLTPEESARIKKIKGAIRGGRVKTKSTKKRLRGELKDIYGRKKQRVAAYDAPLYGSNTTQRGLDDETEKVVEGQYGPAKSSLDREIGAQGQRQAAIAQFYKDYDTAAQAAGAQQAQMYADAVKASQADRDAATSTEQNANAQLLQTMQADAARSGQAVNPQQFLQANQAVSARAQTSNAGTDRLRAASISNQTYNADIRRVGTAAQNYDTQREGRFTSGLREKRRGLDISAGGAAAEYRSKRDEALFQRGLAAEALGVDKYKARLDAKDDAARRALDAKRVDNDTRRTDWATDPNNPDNQPKPAPGDKPTRTPTQVHNDKIKWKNNRDTIKVLKRHGKIKPGQGQKGIDYLVGKGLPEDWARAAVMDALYGGVDAKTQAQIKKQYGFTLKLSPTAKKKRRK